MSRLLKWLGVLRAALLLAIIVLLVGGRFSDGPLGPIAGGAFSSGERFAGSEPDWGFVRDLQTVELQLIDPPRSRTTWILEHEGRIYIPSGYMNSTLGRWWKQWPHEADRDGRALLRVDSVLYERELIRLAPDADVLPALGAELQRKYPRGLEETSEAAATPASVSMKDRVADGSLWIFELAPPRLRPPAS